MKSKYELAKNLLEELELYESEIGGKEGNIASFTNWLNKRYGYMQQPDWPAGLQNPEGHEESGVVLSILLTLLFRAAKHYMKKALDDSPLSTMDEFGFLATLSEGDSMTKSELIHNNLLEFTSGIEIIKRLKNNGLIDESPDPMDKRSKRVKISEKGKMVFYQALQPMDLVSTIVSGDLTQREKSLILPILIKLNNFHSVVHKQDKKSDLQSIIDKYLPNSLN
ncbi:MAG: winged helix DNA-binding protein [Bacteroidia bacterium]|nr:winged helix DNA-binding protein [Bacteroidia bacterium]